MFRAIWESRQSGNPGNLGIQAIFRFSTQYGNIIYKTPRQSGDMSKLPGQSGDISKLPRWSGGIISKLPRQFGDNISRWPRQFGGDIPRLPRQFGDDIPRLCIGNLKISPDCLGSLQPCLRQSEDSQIAWNIRRLPGFPDSLKYVRSVLKFICFRGAPNLEPDSTTTNNWATPNTLTRCNHGDSEHIHPLNRHATYSQLDLTGTHNFILTLAKTYVCLS